MLILHEGLVEGNRSVAADEEVRVRGQPKSAEKVKSRRAGRQVDALRLSDLNQLCSDLHLRCETRDSP